MTSLRRATPGGLSRRIGRSFTPLFCLAALAACGEVEEETPGDPDGGTPGADAGEPGFSLVAGPPRIEARLDEIAEVEVEIERDPGFSDAVVVMLEEIPNGVFASEVTIGESESRGTMEIDARHGPAGALAEVTLRAVSVGGVTRTDTRELFLVGARATIDEDFGDGGRIEVLEFARVSQNQPARVVEADDGALIFGGALADQEHVFAARYLPDGTIDPDFGDGGVASVSLAEFNASITSALLAVQSDGSIILATTVLVEAGDDDLVVARLTPDGELDTSFAGGGLASHPLGTAALELSAIELLSNDRVVLAGQHTAGDFSVSQVLVVRLSENGFVDTSFDGNGVSTTFLTGGGNLGRGVVAQADGKLLVSATTSPGGQRVPKVLRLRQDGSLDTDFGTEGVVELPHAEGGVPNAIEVRDGAAVIAGAIDTAGEAVLGRLWQLTSDGTLDAGFGNGGVLHLPPLEVPQSLLTDLPALGDGRALILGLALTADSSSTGILLARTDGGDLDESFGFGGVALGPVEGATLPFWGTERDEHRLLLFAVDANLDRYELIQIWR